MNPYYKAYDERYRTAHAHGIRWSSDQPTPIVLETLEKYQFMPSHQLLEIGCGEARDAGLLLNRGFDLLAADVSPEVIVYCRSMLPRFSERFQQLDCLVETLPAAYDFIYAVAVVHMLVPDADRDRFYQFIRRHLRPNGLALICSMGDGTFEMQSDISQAFVLQERQHETGPIMVAGTSCRMVSFAAFEQELWRNHLRIVEQGLTSSMPDFDSLMYAVVARD